MLDDDDWLADEEGNLRPDVARALLEGNGGPAPAPTAEEVFAALVRPIRNLLGVLLLVIALSLVCHHRRSAVTNMEPADPAASPSAHVVGTHVHLRAGPGLHQDVLEDLDSMTPVDVRGQDNSWCTVSLSDDRVGWIFGAYVAGPGQVGLGPFVLVRDITPAAGDYVPAGSHLLVESMDENGRYVARLPDGRRLRLDSRSIQPAQ